MTADAGQTSHTTSNPGKETFAMDNLIPREVADFLRWLIDQLED